MNRPPLGFTFRVSLEDIRDGDTITVRVKDGHVWAVRVLDLWCPEKHTEFGKLAKRACAAFLKDKELYWHIDPPKDTLHLAKLFTFDRIPSTIWVGDHVTLRELMVTNGFGFANKKAQGDAERLFETDSNFRQLLTERVERFETCED